MDASTSMLALGSIPISRTRLIGRETEATTARALLLNDAVPLLTLTGPGGVGKTRLALAVAEEVAHNFVDGIVWVDLSSLADSALVPTVVAEACGVAPSGEGPIVADLSRALRLRQTLLLLDNCEHVLPATSDFVAALLATCPALQFLATSRASLRVRGEQILVVSPLPVPVAGTSELEGVQLSPAVDLFVQRARAVDATFALTAQNAGAVAEICRHLDGLPLAVELAAARTRALAPAAMLTLLHEVLPVLAPGARDAPARHQTMRAAIAWSCRLLTPEEQVFFRQLAAFAGGWTLQAAATVTVLPLATTIEHLTTLVEQSLVQPVAASSAPRFTLLETIRTFAADQLIVHDEHHGVRDSHAAYFGEACTREADSWPSAGPSVEGLAWMEAEHPNIRAALTHLLEGQDPEATLRLGIAVADFWFTAGYGVEGIAWLRRGLAQAGAGSGVRTISVQTRGRALAWIATLATRVLDRTALVESEESVALWTALGDVSADRAFAVLQLGELSHLVGKFARAESLLGEAATRYETLGDHAMTAVALANQACAARLGGALERAERYVAAAWQAVEQDAQPWPVAFTLMIQGDIALSRQDDTAALASYQEALAAGLAYGDRVRVGDVLLRIGIIAAHGNDAIRAARLFGAAAGIREAIGQTAPRYVQADYDPAVTRVEQSLGRDVMREAWTAGRLLSLAESVAEAQTLGAPSRSVPVASPSSIPALVANPPFDLTRREREILALLCQRLTDPEIATMLFLSPRTVEKHVGNILGKLGAASRRDAAAVAVRCGLV